MHRDEVARTQQRLRIEALQAKAVEELGIDPEVLDRGVRPAPARAVRRRARTTTPTQIPEPAPYVRETQEKRLRKAERALSALGRVNPLALEEFAALEERHKFLTEQLEDLKKSKRDLLDIVREVDERVEQVFTEAFHDTAAQFERRLQPAVPRRRGPADPHRPEQHAHHRHRGRGPPARARRSSGCRCSPVASARWSRWRCWSSIFKARPSPFYIMDEVEAALDDANLGRLITLFEELRDSSQLIVITHQKRTMEVADALYGVSMRGDGVTTVVSQRIRDVAAQSA